MKTLEEYYNKAIEFRDEFSNAHIPAISILVTQLIEIDKGEELEQIKAELFELKEDLQKQGLRR